MVQGKVDRQAQRLRQLAISHLNIAASHLDAARQFVKNGMAPQAIVEFQKVIQCIEAANDALPLVDTTREEVGKLLGTQKPNEPAPAPPVPVGSDAD